MELTHALRTTGAVRDFLPDPVGDDVLYRVLDTARFAPNGGNRQAWRAIVVRDRALKATLRDLYLPGWYEDLAQSAAGLAPRAPLTPPAPALRPPPPRRRPRARAGRPPAGRGGRRGGGGAPPPPPSRPRSGPSR